MTMVMIMVMSKKSETTLMTTILMIMTMIVTMIMRMIIMMIMRMIVMMIMITRPPRLLPTASRPLSGADTRGRYPLSSSSSPLPL